ncbi:MAG: phosphatidylglycerol:prolipoprotein diacylglycerol transferase [Chloroflexi bacterium]|nr:MAG: phosphatidylglycerol:prolipoprotein diacylglycerol transferase [Chloroflexota bacterium]MBA4376134.1 prolipoprotein diacylglyceryl transferase [Anaerolinea sp.]
MLTISIDPILFSIGHFHLRWYSLIVTAAMFIGVWIAMREAGRKGFNTEDVANSLLWVVIAGLIGARVFHVIDHWPDEYAANPIRALYIWEGGLAIWGGVIGGLIAAAILARVQHWGLPRLLDALVPGVVLGQAIGRIACIITGDAVGKPTDGPFGFAYTSPDAMVPQLGVYYTPTPVYEILMNLSIFALLWSLRKKNLPDGVLTLIYLVLYSSMRFFIAFTSSYKVIAMGLNQAQIISVLVFAVSLPLLAITTLKFRQSYMKV